MPQRVLVIDIGGNNVKMLATGRRKPRKHPSGPQFTPEDFVHAVHSLTADWDFDVITVGFPGPLVNQRPAVQPGNLGSGWLNFDFAAALGKPVRVLNDAVLQAFGAYEGGRMLFLGLGTGLGSSLIDQKVIVPLELGELTHGASRWKVGELLGDRGYKRLGLNKWRQLVREISEEFKETFLADYLVVGGGNAKHLARLPKWMKRGHNNDAFRGGFRAWQVNPLSVTKRDSKPPTHSQDGWRLLY